MLCCLIALATVTGAWIGHRLRLIGGIALLAAVAAAGGLLAWEGLGHATHAGAAPEASTALCSGSRAAIARDAFTPM